MYLVHDCNIVVSSPPKGVAHTTRTWRCHECGDWWDVFQYGDGKSSTAQRRALLNLFPSIRRMKWKRKVKKEFSDA